MTQQQWDPNNLYDPRTPGPYRPPQPPPAKKKHWRPTTATVIVLSCVALLAAGMLVSTSRPQAVRFAPGSGRGVEQSPPAIPGDGTWRVGPDVKAGSYHAMVPASSPLCYVERTDSDGGIIKNQVGTAGYSMYLKVLATDASITVRGCGVWIRVAP
jgi:hypothetical protein